MLSGRHTLCYDYSMQQCSVVSFITPDQYQLNGLLFGEDTAKQGFILVHGLGSSAFAQHDSLLPLVDSNTLALFFNSRGHDKIGNVRKLLPDTEKGYHTQGIGEAHEVFSDCADDIQGAVDFLAAKGVADIYLVGHSTGCQKSVYYASQRSKNIKGIVLLCPLSDYAYARANESKETLAKATAYAQKLVAEGRPHELLPLDISEDLLDAQRYLSLYTPDSIEEIFSYSQDGKVPTAFQSITIPMLAVFAEKDEFADRPAREIAAWFEAHAQAPLTTSIVADSFHNLREHGDEVAATIQKWTSNVR